MYTSQVVIVVALVAAQPLMADQAVVEEVVVVGEQDRRIFELAETVDVVPDSAALLKKTVGANVISNGPLTGIAQYRGMSRFRINTQVNGAVVSAGGPNWMDPPLSYAPAAHLESLEVCAGSRRWLLDKRPLVEQSKPTHGVGSLATGTRCWRAVCEPVVSR